MSAWAVGHPRTDADYIQILVGEHLAVIGVEPLGTRALAGRGAALGIGIGHSDQIHLLQVPVNGFQPVAVVAGTRAPDDSGFVALTHNSHSSSLSFIELPRLRLARPRPRPKRLPD